MLCLNAVELDFIKDLLKHKVRFLIVGGHAVIYYGHMRVTKDLDLLIETSSQNIHQLRLAFAAMGIDLDDERVKRMGAPKAIIPIHKFRIELLTSVDGISFSEAYAEALFVMKEGVNIPMISFAHLLLSKRAANRESDLEDVKTLLEINRA
jgi:predicted nucleotidyltransferase